MLTYKELIIALKAYLQAGAIKTEQLRVRLDKGEISLLEFLSITSKEEKDASL